MKRLAKNRLKCAATAIIIAFCLTGCVSNRGYREVKAQMLRGEFELAGMRHICDSLTTVCAQQEKKIEITQQQNAALKSKVETLSTQISRLEVDNELLREEIKRQ